MFVCVCVCVCINVSESTVLADREREEEGERERETETERERKREEERERERKREYSASNAAVLTWFSHTVSDVVQCAVLPTASRGRWRCVALAGHQPLDTAALQQYLSFKTLINYINTNNTTTNDIYNKNN